MRGGGGHACCTFCVENRSCECVSLFPYLCGPWGISYTCYAVMLAPIPVSRGHSVPACACCRRLWLVLLFLWLLARHSAKRNSRNPVLLKQTPLLQFNGWAWANPQNLSSAPEQGFSLRNWCSNCHLLRLNWPEGAGPKLSMGFTFVLTVLSSWGIIAYTPARTTVRRCTLSVA